MALLRSPSEFSIKARSASTNREKPRLSQFQSITAIIGNALRATNHFKSIHSGALLHGSKTELGATTRQRVNDSADVIANQAEARRATVLLNCATKGGLGIAGQTVGFIQND
jgi:hypothetical protein